VVIPLYQLRRVGHADFSAEDRAFKYVEMLNAEDGECMCGGEAAEMSAYVHKTLWCDMPPVAPGKDLSEGRGPVGPRGRGAAGVICVYSIAVAGL
jgi:hypothetical protein